MCVGARTVKLSSDMIFVLRSIHLSRSNPADKIICAGFTKKAKVEQSLKTQNNSGLTILILEDIEETRDGIEKLLTSDGYRIVAARSEQDAVENALRNNPDLILVSLGGSSRDVIKAARNVRERAALSEDVPVVVFCIEEIGEGDEVAIGQNIFLTRPDNFNQLRNLLAHLLQRIPAAA